MNSSDRFRCPACGFAVFNRRCLKCERCGALLPSTVQLSPQELAFLADEAAKNEKLRKDMAREAQALEARRRRDSGYDS